MKRFLPATFFLLFVVILFSLHFSRNFRKVQAETATHVIISEIQIAGDGADSANDEFIELYNPTDNTIDISNWSIQRETIGGSFAKKNFVSPASIPAHGFYLIAHASFNGAVTSDLSHSSFILSSTGTTIFLVNDKTLLAIGNEVSIVDKVAIGTLALNAEGAPFTSIPTNDLSIERKANSSSIAVSMSIGGSDEFLGNGEDTDNNSNDFLTRSTPGPQNSNSSIEPIAVPSPTPTPTSTPTPTLTPTSTPTLTPTPTPTLVPSSASDNSDSSNSPTVSSAACNDSKPGSAPQLLSARAGVNSIFLRWSEVSDPVSYYLVAYGSSPGVAEYGNPNVGGRGSTSYTVSGLSAGKTYYFKVRAGNGCAPGDFSNELSASPLGKEINSDLANNFTQKVLGVSEEKIIAAVPTPIPTSVPTKNAEQPFLQKALILILSPLALVWKLISRLKFF